MDIEKIYRIYDTAVKIRLIEEAIITEYPQKEIRTPVHLCVGQEGIAAGVTFNLSREDYIVSNHRCHGHCIAKGLSLEGFFSELYGKAGGVSRGRGGSMHLVDMKNGILGTSAIVAGGIPIAAGAALSLKLRGCRNIVAVYFGDGAVDEGIFWETINIASLKKLPILFVMEDNQYASQTHVSIRHSYEDICKIISGFSIPVYKLDGNDAVEVAEISGKAIANIRRGDGPAFLYCRTYRWLGHVGESDDSHTGYRSDEDVRYWKGLCPIKRLEERLNCFDPNNAGARINEIRNGWNRMIEKALIAAKEMQYALD
ncbi:MAG: thiamine pyrophosphate-dependent dehydrogenase E1 component subunit alpha [Ruminiclostridium sp.]|nr:thiamine pyrophosphate-dependent dehydrogenase E1 component subunit alpha [Ruminiclostridium sp.]